MKTIIDSNVANVFEGYPERYRQPLLQIRELIFSTAASLNAVGEVEESLKWNQPSYATTITKSGAQFVSIVLVLKKLLYSFIVKQPWWKNSVLCLEKD